MVKHRRIGHDTPSEREITRHQIREPVKTIALTREHARRDLNVSARRERVSRVLERRSGRGVALQWWRCNQNTGRVINAALTPVIKAEPECRRDEGGE